MIYLVEDKKMSRNVICITVEYSSFQCDLIISQDSFDNTIEIDFNP